MTNKEIKGVTLILICLFLAYYNLFTHFPHNGKDEIGYKTFFHLYIGIAMILFAVILAFLIFYYKG